jgi:PAS domain S-box-containing protein
MADPIIPERDKDNSDRFSVITDHMVLIGFGLAIFYWIVEWLLSVFSGNRADFFHVLFQTETGALWKFLIILCLFLIFGSHAQFTIEKRRRAEAALRQSEEKHRTLFETMAQGAIYQTAAGEILSINPSAERILGVSGTEISTIHVLFSRCRFVREDGFDFPESEFPGILALQTGRSIEGVILGARQNHSRNLKWISVNAVPQTGERGSTREVFVTFDDITELKQAGETLRRQNEYMAALHETTLGLIHRLDLNDLLQALVSRAAQLAGTLDGFLYIYHPEKDILEMKVGIGAYAELTGYTLKPGEGITGQVWQKETPLVIHDYQSWPDHLSHPLFESVKAVMAIPLKSGGHVDGVIGIGHSSEQKTIGTEDVRILEQFAKLASIALDNAQLYTQMQRELSERKRAEKESREMEIQLRRAQKMEAMGTLAGGIAHDFNNILGAIIGFTEMAIHDIESDTRAHHNMHQVLKAGNRAKELVRQILSFTRETRREKESILMAPLLKETLELLRASLPTTITFHQHVEEDPGMIFCNASEIHQVIMNLCTNAAHAMEDKGGELTVRLEKIQLKPGQMPGMNPGDYQKLTIRDTGHGMNAETVERIFDPYFSTKTPEKGTGLGLAIVHRIVQDCGGLIQVDSRPESGTVFEVFFPLVVSEKRSETEPVLPPSSGKQERILFVDDEPVLVELGKEMLDRLGYRVEARQDPREALAAFTQAPNRYDLVITDMTMPHMTGDVLSEKLMAVRPDIPIIVCTGFSEQINPEKAKRIGIRDLIMKPVSMEDLSRSIHRALTHAQSTQREGKQK